MHEGIKVKENKSNKIDQKVKNRRGELFHPDITKLVGFSSRVDVHFSSGYVRFTIDGASQMWKLPTR